MLHASLATVFQHVQKSDHVGLDVSMRVGQRVSDARLSGQVNDAIESLSSKALLHSLPVGYVGKREAKAGSLHQLSESGPLEIHVIVFVHVVQAQHLLPIVKKSL